jgi:hypothetical protein
MDWYKNMPSLIIVFNFTCTIKKIQGNHEEFELNGTQQLLLWAEDVSNLL